MTDAIDTTAPQAGFHIESAKSWIDEAVPLMDEALKHCNTTADALLNAALAHVREARGNLDEAERSPPLASSGKVGPDASATQAPPSEPGKTVRRPIGDTLSLARDVERLIGAAVQFEMSPETDTLLLEATRKFERLIDELEAADQAAAETPPAPPPADGVDTLNLENDLIRLGMIRDLVFYLSDAEGGGRLDAPGSSLAPVAKCAALSLIASEIKETQDRMYRTLYPTPTTAA